MAPAHVLLPASRKGEAIPSASAWGPFDDYRSTYHTFRRVLGRILEPFGLAVTEYSALRLSSTGPVRPSFLSLQLGISPAATTDLLDRLEGRELLRRDRDASDRRATAVTLTRTGARLYRQASQAHRAFLETLAREMRSEDLEALRTGSKELRRVLESRARDLGVGPKEG